jgi:uncharacterized membrane protein YhaH (DUF805 family)
VSFIEAIQSGFRNYVNFNGRASRSEFWYWVLFALLIGIAASIIDSIVAPNSVYGPLSSILALAFFLPGLAVSVRRLHDLDRSGWFVLLHFIPLIGSIILLIWFCMRGTLGSNRFGPDPLEARVSSVA